MGNISIDKISEKTRVTIVIKDGADKQDVIDAVCDAMKDEPSFKLRYTKLGNNIFTADIAYKKIDLIKKIEGVETVQMTRRVGLHN